MAWDPVFGESRLRVAKLPVKVSVTLEGGTALEGDVHVFPGSGQSRERVVDLLNGPEAFLPLTGRTGAAVIGKSAIAILAVADLLDARMAAQPEAAIPEVEVEITLRGVPGARGVVRGRLRIDMPPDQSRLLDLLNAEKAFFAVLVGTGAVLVNRDRIAHVRAVTAASRRQPPATGPRRGPAVTRPSRSASRRGAPGRKR